MSGPPLLREGDEDVASLFASLEREDVPVSAKARTMARIADVPPAAAVTSPLAARATGVSGRWKTVLGFATLVVLVGGGVHVAGERHEPAAPPLAPASSVVFVEASRAAVDGSEPPFAESGTTLTLRVEDLPAAASSNAPSRGAAPSPRPSAVAETLDDELVLVEASRAALSRRDATTCLSTIATHDRRFPQGIFAEEMSVMRIEALALRDERDHARALTLARRYLAEHPRSPYAERVRSVLGALP